MKSTCSPSFFVFNVILIAFALMQNVGILESSSDFEQVSSCDQVTACFPVACSDNIAVMY